MLIDIFENIGLINDSKSTKILNNIDKRIEDLEKNKEQIIYPEVKKIKLVKNQNEYYEDGIAYLNYYLKEWQKNKACPSILISINHWEKIIYSIFLEHKAINRLDTFQYELTKQIGMILSTTSLENKNKVYLEDFLIYYQQEESISKKEQKIYYQMLIEEIKSLIKEEKENKIINFHK